MNWLKIQVPHVSAMMPAWQLARTMYTGEGASSYLLQHMQGEGDTSFAERVSLAQFVPYVSTVIDALAGILFEKEAEIVRDWGFLGRPETAGTLAYQLSRDIDGAGMNYSTMLRRAAVDLLLFNELWFLVDGDRVRPLPPTAVPNYIELDGRLASALVKEVVDVRTSITEPPEQVDQYVLYGPQGYTRWQDKNGTAVQVSAGTYAENGRTYIDRSGLPTPPIFRVQLPWRRYVARTLAESARTLYNMGSDRDALLRAASYPKLIISGDDQFFGEQVENLRKGSNAIQRLQEWGDHSYIAPPVDGIEAANATLEQKERAYYRHAWDLIASEGQVQKTATQVALERSAGLASALSMLAATMEEIETRILWLLAQSLSDRPSDWNSVSADWGAIDYSGVTVETPEAAPAGAPSGE